MAHMEPEERRYHHGDLRSALLERAETTVRIAGVDALSLRELAREIGVSHAAPRRHFRDKNALLDALAVSGFARLDQTLRAAVAQPAPTFRDRLVLVAVSYVAFAADNAALLDLMFTGKHESYASEELRRSAARCFDSVNRLVRGGQDTGDLRAADLNTQSTVMFATLQGLATLTAGGMIARGELDGLTRSAVEVLLDGLTPRD